MRRQILPVSSCLFHQNDLLPDYQYPRPRLVDRFLSLGSRFLIDYLHHRQYVREIGLHPGTTKVSLFSAAVPHTPLPNGIRTHAGNP